MLVFFLHGYPDGCIIYSDLVTKLLDINCIPIVINNRTGISLSQNILLVKEIIETYPKNSPKTIIAHDWGAVLAWKLLKHFDDWNIVKFVCLSVSFLFCAKKNRTLGERTYQLSLWLSKFIPSCMSNPLQTVVVSASKRNLKFNNPRSAYYYSLKYAFGYTIGIDKYFCSLKDLSECKTSILFITSTQDKDLGFAPSIALDTLKDRGDHIINVDSNHFFVHNLEFLYPIIKTFILKE